MLTSPVLKSTGSEGFCVTFSYAMDGLSTDKLRLLLQVHTCHVTCLTNILLETLNIAIYVQSYIEGLFDMICKRFSAQLNK